MRIKFTCFLFTVFFFASFQTTSAQDILLKTSADKIYDYVFKNTSERIWGSSTALQPQAEIPDAGTIDLDQVESTISWSLGYKDPGNLYRTDLGYTNDFHLVPKLNVLRDLGYGVKFFPDCYWRKTDNIYRLKCLLKEVRSDQRRPYPRTLLNIVLSAYNNMQSEYIEKHINDISGSEPLYAKIYQYDDQVVVVFLDMELKNTYSELIDYLSDPLWVNEVSSTYLIGGSDNSKITNSTIALIKRVKQGADLLLKIKDHPEFQSSDITLTGYSLGGAVASILGIKTGLPVVAFNAPQIGSFINDVNIVSSTHNLNEDLFRNTGNNVNLRLEGDQISKLGKSTPSVSVITIPDIKENSAAVSGWTNIQYTHGIDTLNNKLISVDFDTYNIPLMNKPFIGISEQDITEKIIMPASVSCAEGSSKETAKYSAETAMSFNVNVNSSVVYAIDPLPANEYQLILDQDSPSIASITLPALPNVSSYKINTLKDGSWDSQIIMNPLQNYTFGVSIKGFKFCPIDSFGNNVDVQEPFVFDISFNKNGAFKANLKTIAIPKTETSTPNNPLTPDPSQPNPSQNQISSKSGSSSGCFIQSVFGL